MRDNKFDNLKIRVLNGLPPDEQISDPSTLFPTQKVLKEEKGLEDLTMLLKIKPNKLSDGKFAIREKLMF